MPHVLVAPDSFKGTFDAASVARAIGEGIERAGLTAELCPVADGGEGTMSAILAARGGRLVRAKAHDPLGREIDAAFALLNDGTALVETAAASGLGLLEPRERDPWAATTYGTGELICSALDAGAETVLVASGGSATVDGGAGALRALSRRRGGLGGARIVVLCDVRTSWERCAQVYGPQKGADDELVRRLASRLDGLAGMLPRDPRGVPATGAAGGLSGALWAVHDAALEPGAARVLDALRFGERLQGAVAVIAGEGRIDAQSAEGKVVAEISQRARRHGVPVYVIVGQRELDEASRLALGIDSIVEAQTLDAIAAQSESIARGLRTHRIS
jgi:glycerate kinase